LVPPASPPLRGKSQQLPPPRSDCPRSGSIKHPETPLQPPVYPPIRLTPSPPLATRGPPQTGQPNSRHAELSARSWVSAASQATIDPPKPAASAARQGLGMHRARAIRCPTRPGFSHLPHHDHCPIQFRDHAVSAAAYPGAAPAARRRPRGSVPLARARLAAVVAPPAPASAHTAPA